MTKHTEDSVLALLAERYAAPEWAFFPQVPNATGGAKSRTADALAMNLWPSKGLHLYGFEIKVSRSDWQKEMQDPTKADAFARYCHCWCVVAPAGIVKVAELPPSWGLLEITSSGSLRSRKAVEPTEPREPISLPFLAGLLRAASNGRNRDLNQRYNDGYRNGVESGASHAAADVAAREKQLARREADLERAAAMLAEATGYDAGDDSANAQLRLLLRMAAALRKCGFGNTPRNRWAGIGQLRSFLQDSARVAERMAAHAECALPDLLELEQSLADAMPPEQEDSPCKLN